MPDIKIVQGAKNNSIMLANYMIDHATIQGQHFAYSEKEKMLYVYNGRIYEPFEDIDLDRFFREFMVQYQITEIWKNSRLSEITRALKVSESIPRVEMDNEGNKMCFKNGILDLDTMDFVPHSPSYHFASYIDSDYLPEVGDNPKVFKEVLNKIFWKNTGDMGPDFETIKMIQRVGGALIFPKNKLKQLFIFLGGGANGKSMLFNVFSMFFPADRVTYMTLGDLSRKTCDRSGLFWSWLNISTEAKGETIDSEEIKKIIYGEGIVYRKKFKDDMTLIPKTKCVVASNSRPYFNDTSYGLERRLTVISCNSRFVPLEMYKKIVNPDRSSVFLAEDDDALMDKLKAEAPQILNYFLVGLRELIELGWQLPRSENVERAKEEYVKENDTVGTWLRDNYEVDYDGFGVTVNEILASYREWYYSNVSTRALNFAVNTMGGRIKEIFRIEPVRILKNGSKITAYKLKKKYESIDDGGPVDEFVRGYTKRDTLF